MRQKQFWIVKYVVLAALFVPLISLIYALASNALGANPTEQLTRELGQWALRLLCATLAITPIRKLTGWHHLARFRRMLGVSSFCYALLHFVAYAWFDQGLYWMMIIMDVTKRQFILIGVVMLVLMFPLALTSFNRAVRWMGAQRWQRLHRLVYLISILAVLHFWWLRSSKNNLVEPFVYAAIVATLLGLRIWFVRRKSRATKK